MPQINGLDILRYKKALDFSYNLYKNKFRKGIKIPYFTYLLSVSNLVIENNGNSDEAIASLFNEAIEENSGNKNFNLIKKKFGARVANIVKQCSNSQKINLNNENWIEEKKKFLDSMQKKTQTSLFVSLCDKYHSSSCIINDYNKIGKKLWNYYPTSSENLLWYYKSLCKNFKKFLNNQKHLKDKFQRNINELGHFVKK